MEMIVRGGGLGAAPAEPVAPAGGNEGRLAETAEAARELDRLVEALAGRASGGSAAPGARRALEGIVAAGGAEAPALAAAGESLAAAETARQLQETLRTASAGLGRGLAAVAALPLPMAQKEGAALAVLRRAQRLGLVGEDPGLPAFLASHLRLAEGQQRIAGSRAEGEAAAVAAKLAADPALLPADRVALETLARQRGAVEQHRRQADLRAREAEDRAAFAAGRVEPRLSEESFHRLYGPEAGARRWQDYAAAAEQGHATATIRGRDAAAIAAAEAAWAGDPAVFQAARAADAAARAADPLGYALATREGLAQALVEAESPAERARIACAAQEVQGAGACRLWTAAESAAMADAWDALPPGAEGRNARLDFFRTHLLPLDTAQRPDAIRQLVADGIADGTAPEIAALLADLEAGRNNLARRKAVGLTANEQARQPDATESVISPDRGDQTVPENIGEAHGKAAQGQLRPLPDDRRLVGLPNVDEPVGAWEVAPYPPNKQSLIATLARDILLLREDPRLPQVLEDYARAVREGRDWVSPEWMANHPIWGRLDALGETDPNLAGILRGATEALLDPASELNVVGAVDDLLRGIADRAERGRHPLKAWADAAPDLAEAESGTNIKFRPASEPGFVAVVEPGQVGPSFNLPLALVVRLADHPEPLADFVGLAGKIARRELRDDEVEAWAARLTRRIETPSETDPDGVAGSLRNRPAELETAAAIRGAMERLGEGGSQEEVFFLLAQFVLHEELNGDDIGILILESAIQFHPAYDAVDLAINAGALFVALRDGDTDAAVEAGFGAAMAAVGLAFPVLGKLAKGALGWVGRSIGVLKGPRERAFEALTDVHHPNVDAVDGSPGIGHNAAPDGETLDPDIEARANGPEPLPTPYSLTETLRAGKVTEFLDVMEQRLRHLLRGDRKRLQSYLDGGPQNSFSVPKMLTSPEFKQLVSDPRDRVLIKRFYGYMNGQRGELGEQVTEELVFALPFLRNLEPAPRQLVFRFTHLNGTVSQAPVDITMLPPDSPLLQQIRAGLIGTSANPLTADAFVRAGGWMIEVKTGMAKHSKAGVRIRDEIEAAARAMGREGAWLAANMPTRDLPLDRHISLVREFGRHVGLTDDAIELVVLAARRNTRPHWPAAATVAFTTLMMAAVTLLPDEDESEPLHWRHASP